MHSLAVEEIEAIKTGKRWWWRKTKRDGAKRRKEGADTE
jgi:hypothetical protein